MPHPFIPGLSIFQGSPAGIDLVVVERKAHSGPEISGNPYYIWTAVANSLRTESATRIQELAPTRAAADKLYEERLVQAAKVGAPAKVVDTKDPAVALTTSSTVAPCRYW